MRLLPCPSPGMVLVSEAARVRQLALLRACGGGAGASMPACCLAHACRRVAGPSGVAYIFFCTVVLCCLAGLGQSLLWQREGSLSTRSAYSGQESFPQSTGHSAETPPSGLQSPGENCPL